MNTNQIVALLRFLIKDSRLVICLFLVFFFGAHTLNGGNDPPEVLNAAMHGLQPFLAHIPPGEKELYGFSKDDDMTQASLGRPLLMHTIEPTSLASTQLTVAVSSLVSETTMWCFPVMLGTEAKAMLVVDREAGAWKAVSLGYGSLAHELNYIWKQWPESKGFHPKLITVLQVKRFYFTVPEVDDFNLTQIVSPQRTSEASGVPTPSSKGPSVTYSALDSLSNTVQDLRSALRSEGAEPMH